MITADEARFIAQRHLDTVYPPVGGRSKVVIADVATVERPYGWMFMYTSARHLETGDESYALIGNGPLLVRRGDGAVIEFSSFYTRDAALEAYEKDPASFAPPPRP